VVLEAVEYEEYNKLLGGSGSPVCRHSKWCWVKS